MTKKLNIQTDELSSEEEDFLSFADEQPVENAGWLRRAVGSGAHVIAEVTGISNILKSPKPLSAEEEDDDNYTPFIEDTNALKYIPTYDATPTQKKNPSASQFGNVEAGYTNFNNVAKDIYSQAQNELKQKQRKKKSEHTFINLLFKILLLAVVGLVAAAGYKKFQNWSQTSQSVTAKLLREKLNKKPKNLPPETIAPSSK